MKAPSRHLCLEDLSVTLRPLDARNDADALWHAASPQTNGSDLFVYNLGTGPFSNATEFSAYLAKKAIDADGLTLSIRSRRLGLLVGCVSLLNVRTEHGCIEVGSLWYTKAAQRSEVNTHTMFLLFQHVFEHLGCRRLEWKCNNDNQESKRAALRLGFSYEGLFRQHFWDKGRNRDTAWFSIIDSEWPAVKNRFVTQLLVGPGSRTRSQ